MILYQPFKAEHFKKMVLQPEQAHLKDYFTYDLLKALEGNDAYTFTVNAVPVAFCGLVRLWPGRAIMWCFMSEMTMIHKLQLTRLIKDYIDYIDITRLEIYVDVDFDGAHRWAKMLGFVCEAPLMRKFQVNGTDNALYARVKE